MLSHNPLATMQTLQSIINIIVYLTSTAMGCNASYIAVIVEIGQSKFSSFSIISVYWGTYCDRVIVRKKLH